MNQPFLNLVGKIRQRFPSLDIRTDQCATIRVMNRSILVGIEQREKEYLARFFSLENGDGLDFETKVVRTVISTDLSAFESEVLNVLRSLGN